MILSSIIITIKNVYIVEIHLPIEISHHQKISPIEIYQPIKVSNPIKIST